MADAPTDEQMAEKLKEFGLTSFKTDPISAALKFYEWYAAQVAPPKLKAPDRDGVWAWLRPDGNRCAAELKRIDGHWHEKRPPSIFGPDSWQPYDIESKHWLADFQYLGPLQGPQGE